MRVFVLSVYTSHEGLCHTGIVKINPKYLPSFVIIQMDICITTKKPPNLYANWSVRVHLACTKFQKASELFQFLNGDCTGKWQLLGDWWLSLLVLSTVGCWTQFCGV